MSWVEEQGNDFFLMEEDEDGAVEAIKLPSRFAVCPRCDGHGKHDHPAFSNGITGSEWEEWDDEERDGYFSGRYDVVCGECHGKRVVAEIDWDALDLETARVVECWYREEEAYRHMCESERRYGA